MNKVITFFRADDDYSIESTIGSDFDVKRVLSTGVPDVYITDLVPAGVFIGVESIQYVISTSWDNCGASLLPSVTVEARVRGVLNPSSFGSDRVALEHFNQPLHDSPYLIDKLLGVLDSSKDSYSNQVSHRSYVVKLNDKWVSSFKGAIRRDYCEMESCLFELFKEGIGYFKSVPDSNGLLFDMLSLGCMVRKIHDAKFSIFHVSSSLLDLYLDGVVLDVEPVNENEVRILYADNARITTRFKYPHLKSFTNYAVVRKEDIADKDYTLLCSTNNYAVVSFYENSVDLECAHLPVKVSYSSSGLDVSIYEHSYGISKLISSLYSNGVRGNALATLLIELLTPFAQFAPEASLSELESLVGLFAIKLFADSPICHVFNLLSSIEKCKPIRRSDLRLLATEGLLTGIDKHDSGTVSLKIKGVSEPVNIPPTLVRFW